MTNHLTDINTYTNIDIKEPTIHTIDQLLTEVQSNTKMLVCMLNILDVQQLHLGNIDRMISNDDMDKLSKITSRLPYDMFIIQHMLDTMNQIHRTCHKFTTNDIANDAHDLHCDVCHKRV